ncbi:MAG TPA: ABC transporter ATP-binding protein [Pseudonocardia sp.]|nr:ABC transporter ATP-binding protein [Pseudonocardia sp.]
MALLEVHDLEVRFRGPRGTVTAVDGVSFSLDEGETLAIAGESGSGKSVTGLSLIRLNPTPPCEYGGGQVLFDGRDLMRLSEREMRAVRGNDIAMVFQDPMSSLNPVRRVGDQVAEAVRIHQGVSRREARARAVATLREVGIANPERRADEFPHQYSGGMRQRAMIAMGLACNPKVLIADEPTTALDVTVQAQILELMKDLQRRNGMAIVLITHDFGVVAGTADRVAVMYAGRIVEYTDTARLFADPLMPYTAALLRSVPRLGDGTGERRLTPIAGQPPSMLDLPEGCRFAPRCPLADDDCRVAQPPLERKQPGHHAACIRSPSLVERTLHPTR